MLLAIPYSHKDILCAERLVKWVGFLSNLVGGNMRRESVILVPSQPASQMQRNAEVIFAARDVFGKVVVQVPRVAEVGWPQSCSQMLLETLRMVDGDEDVFFLEPDATPLHPDWWARICEEYDDAGKTFMGGFVGPKQTSKPHMTGVAVYGRDWEKAAPSLTRIGEEKRIPWDVFCAEEILKRAHLTPLVQHQLNPHIPDDLSILKPGAVVFHQCKDGRLIHLLDRNHFGSQFKEPLIEVEQMTKYFHAENVNRRIKAGGYELLFDPYAILGGTWQGVFATDDEGKQQALLMLTHDSRSTVREITEAEYQAAIKKKSLQSQSLRPTQEPPPPTARRPASAAIEAVAGVVVERPNASPFTNTSADPRLVSPANLPATVDELVIVERVEPPTLSEAPKPRGKNANAKGPRARSIK